MLQRDGSDWLLEGRMLKVGDVIEVQVRGKDPGTEATWRSHTVDEHTLQQMHEGADKPKHLTLDLLFKSGTPVRWKA